MDLRHARSRLVALYACLVALTYAIHALPGDPYYRSSGEYGFWLAVDIVLIVLIARGSQVALAVPLALNLFGFVAILFLAISPLAPSLIAFLLVKALETAVLVMLWRHPPVASAPSSGSATVAGR